MEFRDQGTGKKSTKRNQLTRDDYDADGLMIKKTTPEGITNFSYDDKDRLTKVSSPDYHYKYQYGIPGGLSGHTVVQLGDVNNGSWTQHIYNRFGFPTDYYDSFQWRKYYQYNFSQPGGTPIGLAPSIVSYSKWYSSAEHRLVYTYNNGHRLYSKRNDYLKTMKYFSYDTNGSLSSLRYRNVFGYVDFPDINLDFLRDNSGLITSISGDKGLSVNYNSNLEIESVQHTLPQSFGETYSYDSRGNRLNSLTQSYSYNSLNQLTSTATHTYQYDADGNLIEEKNIAAGETKKYFYNSENRLSRFEHYPSTTSPADTVATYKYDLLGRRIQKNVNGTVTHFFWEGDNLAMELDADYQPIRRYLYGVGKDEADGYIEFSEVTGSVFDSSKKGWYSFVKDQVGTVYKVYSHYDKQIVDTRSYDTFGNLVSQTGNSTGNLAFQSKYYDDESGLYYFFYRYYHPVNGRFLNEDPIRFRGGINFYSFVDNNPIMGIDPFGLFKGYLLITEKYMSHDEFRDFTGKINNRGLTRLNPKNTRFTADECECKNGKWSPRFIFVFDIQVFLKDHNAREHEYEHVGDLMESYLETEKYLRKIEKKVSYSSESECVSAAYEYIDFFTKRITKRLNFNTFLRDFFE